MSGVTGALIGGAVIAGGATVAGSAIASNAQSNATNAQVGAANNAANAQLAATQASIAAQEQMADKAAGLFTQYTNQARADLAPFRQAQLDALAKAQGLTDPNNPYYQQQEQYNTTAIQRQLASQGLLRSKSQVDLLTNLQLGLNQQRTNEINAIAGNGAVQQSAQLSQGLGSQLGSLYGQLGGGLGSSYQQQGTNLGNIYLGMGQAIGQGAAAQGQIAAGMVNGIGNTVQGTIGNYLSLSMLNKMMGGGGL